jgi:selenocysteine-specific elongation factor
MIVGTAGHIDHGKTSLVKALTGVDTDRLPEEKARGISIELGFAYFPLSDGQSLGFVDVPGHERFVHTMLAGATGIDFVILVVAADDGVMAQTREHLQILDLLGLGEGVVALTKADLVDADRLDAVSEDIRAMLAGTGLAGADILPVSALTGSGIDVLRSRLADEAMSRPHRARRGMFRMAIDRAFSIPGAGTVVTGAVAAGQIAVGDEVVVLPRGIRSRVRSLHVNGRPGETAATGDRSAVNLAGVDLARADVARGDWLAAPQSAMTTARFDARAFLSPGSQRPLATWSPVYFHAGTSALPGRIVILSAERLGPGESGLVQVVLPRSLPLRHGDRFVLRDIGAERTIGGGAVIDPSAPQRRRRTPERLAALAALETPEAALALNAIAESPPGLIELPAFIAGRGLTASEAEAALADAELTTIGSAPVGTTAAFAASSATLEQLGAAIEAALARLHGNEPALAAIPLERARLGTTPRLNRREIAALCDWMIAQGRLAAIGGGVRLPGHKSALADADMRLWDRLRPHIMATPRHPPTIRDIALAIKAEVQAVRRVAKQLARLGELVEVGTDRFFARSTLLELAAVAEELAARNQAGVFTAADFRDASGTGRNVGIAVLEHFDRIGITVRRGDERRLGKPAAEALKPRG